MSYVPIKKSNYVLPKIKFAIFYGALFFTHTLWADGQLPWSPEPISASVKPRETEGVGITEKLGDQINLAAIFRDEEGKPVTLGQYFHPDRPVLLSMVYFGCPNLCTYHLNTVFDALKTLQWTAGKEFELIAISIDPSEGAELAAKKKTAYLNLYNRPAAAPGLHFLTGTQEQMG